MINTTRHTLLTLYLNKYFPIVKASELSLEDSFLLYEPQDKSEALMKEAIKNVIEKRVQDFRAQVMDPSINEEGRIVYKQGAHPAVGKSVLWWEENSTKVIPGKKSKLGTLIQRHAFLGCLIKQLVDNGMSTNDAWHAVCGDSKSLGNYANSANSTKSFEPTGSRQICNWFDLANTSKILEITDWRFPIAGGNCLSWGMCSPLSTICNAYPSETPRFFDVGWIVMEV